MPFGPMKVSLLEEAFMSVPAQRSLGPVYEVHNVFGNRDLCSSSGEKPRATTAVRILEVY